MCLEITATFALFICTAIFICPLAIICIVLGAVHPSLCDHTDIMGLNTSGYLLGLGITSLVTSLALVILHITKRRINNPLLDTCIAYINGFNALFGTIWCIIGGVILYRSNVDCINVGSVQVVWGLVMWCLSVLHICSSSKAVHSRNVEQTPQT